MKVKLAFLAIAAVAVVGVTILGPAAKTSAFVPRNYGIVSMKFDLGKQPPYVAPRISDAAQLFPSGFYLSDIAGLPRFGTFDLNLYFTQLNAPVFDSFRVTNTSNEPKVLTYVFEDQKISPVNPQRVEGELLVCFDVSCQADVYYPDGVILPPAPIAQLQPGETKDIVVGMKLAPNANVANWQGTTIASTLYFTAQ